MTTCIDLSAGAERTIVLDAVKFRDQWKRLATEIVPADVARIEVGYEYTAPSGQYVCKINGNTTFRVRRSTVLIGWRDTRSAIRRLGAGLPARGQACEAVRCEPPDESDLPPLPVVTVPGVVWDDALDPTMTPIQAELGLPPMTPHRVGRGRQARYEQVPAPVARKLASYLRTRATTLLEECHGDHRERDTYRAAIRAADAIDRLP